jgi:L-fuculose-phosphate aldolase
MLNNDENEIRVSLLHACEKLAAEGLIKATSGNVSLRVKNGFLITPSGVVVDQLTPETMVMMSMTGQYEGGYKPSSEWRFHLDAYVNRSDVNAVVHTHSLYAAALSTLRRSVPAFHYMVAVAGGDNIPCTPYALFGTQQLSDHVVQALIDRNACLMANHGLIAVGSSVEKAIYIASEVEGLCQQYMLALQVGEPVILGEAEMQAVMMQFKGYGALAKS